METQQNPNAGLQTTPKTDTVTLASGVTHTLHELTFEDMLDFEEIMGFRWEESSETTFNKEGQEVVRIRDQKAIGVMLWLCVRTLDKAGNWQPEMKPFFRGINWARDFANDENKVLTTLMEFVAAPFGGVDVEETPSESKP